MQTHPGLIFQFGPFDVNPASGELFKNGRRIRLQEQPFRLLVALLETPGQLITREELRARLWPGDTFVDFDGSLRVAVRKLREALEDDAENPRYIETIPKRGYRFLVSEVRRKEAAPQAAATPADLYPVPLATDTSPIDLTPVDVRPSHALPSHAPLWKYGVPAALLFLLAAGALLVRHQRTQPRPLTDQDVLVLADFANSTGDPVFDGTLRQALAIQLEQSPFLKIMDDEQVQQTQRLMGLSPAGRITNQVAHDICVRNAAAATIDGSILSLGKSYIVTLQSITCHNGATLAREQVQADDKEHVLNAVGSAATALRAKLGESRSSIQKLNRPLEQVTTGSLEALQSYTQAYAELRYGRFLAARPLFERAIALDPNFAMAYYALSLAYNNAGDTQQEAQYKRKAFALIDRVSEFEREHIAGGYYESTGELDKAIDVYRLGSANYPRSWHFHNFLSENYLNLGQLEDGLQQGQLAVQMQPDGEPPYRRLLDANMSFDRLAEANQVAQRLRTLGLGGARIHQRFLEMAYLEDDSAAVATEVQWYAGKPDEYLSFGLQAARLNLLGRRSESAKLYRRAADTARRQSLPDVAGGLEEADARADALAGNCVTAHRLGRPALALALCGETAAAEKLAAETSKRFPSGTIWNAVQLPEIRAVIQLQHAQPARAIELLASATPYERAYPDAIYLRGQAYLRLHMGTEAAAEFHKVLDHPGRNWSSTWRYPNWGLYYSLSCLGLARASMLNGDSPQARKSFQALFTLWKDADPDLPILIAARKEYAALH